MNNNSGTHSASNPRVVNDISLTITAIKIVLLVTFLVPFIKYTFLSKQDNENSTSLNYENKSEPKQNETLQFNVASNEQNREVVKKEIIPQPSCPKEEDILSQLNEICSDIWFKFYFCSPEDIHNLKKHKIPRYQLRNKSSKDPTAPAIINYVVGGLLLISLGAALLEYYRAKIQPTKKDGKAPLSRKCSLADLTVMKHHRKELIRRDSILEVPEGRHKPFGFSPPLLQRRCSFPVAQNISLANPYGLIVNNPIQHIPVLDGRRSSILDSKLLIIDNRRISIDRKIALLDGRRISISEQNSPERRHHGRLVNRH